MNNAPPLIIAHEQSVGRVEFQDRVARLAAGLRSMGLGPGDVIALLLNNDIPFMEISMAAARVGVFTVPINWHLKGDEVAYILTDSGARLLFGHAHLLNMVRSHLPAQITTMAVDVSPAIRSVFRLDATACALAGDDVGYETWLRAQSPYVGQGEAALGSIIYTSGTTGRPKGVRRGQVTVEQARVLPQVLDRFFGFTGGGDIRTVIPAPLYHSAPNMYALTAAARGFQVVLMPRFDPHELLRLIDTYKITHLNLVPTMMHRLLHLPDKIRQRYDVSSLRFVVHAAAPCPPTLKRDMMQWWGPIIHEFYGGTETGGTVFCTPQAAISKPGTIGKAVPEADLRIRSERGDEAKVGEAGEIYARLRCFPDFTYINNSEARQAIEWEGLISCGDIGYKDEDDYLFLCDRAKDMIISGGVNIYPAEIEAALFALPGIADCAVFGVPDDEFGEKICAYIQPMDKVSMTVEEVQTALRSQIAHYKVPRLIRFVDQLPREESGKIMKRKLRDPYWANRKSKI